MFYFHYTATQKDCLKEHAHVCKVEYKIHTTGVTQQYFLLSSPGDEKKVNTTQTAANIV